MNLFNLFWDFIFKQLKSVIFGAVILFLIILTNFYNPTTLYRYDLLLILVICIQFIMYKFKLETKRELLAITVFHVLGVGMEIVKVNFHNMWSYNEYAFAMIYGVPIFSGFMYASVGSYITQSTKNLNLCLINYPKKYLVYILAVLIYINFLINKNFIDFRILLIPFSLILFYKTYFTFELRNKVFKMHFLLSFLLISIFIWLAENVATYYGIWKYTSQNTDWNVVDPLIITSWYMLAVLSFIIANSFNTKKNLS